MSDHGLHHQHYETSRRQHHHHQTVRNDTDTTISCGPQYHKGKKHSARPKDEEHGNSQEQSSNSVYVQQGPGFLKVLTEGTPVNPLPQQQPVVLSSAPGSDVANQRTPISLAKLHPSLPDRPRVFVESHPRINTVALSLREKPRSTSNSSATSRLTCDLWDTQREITALQARETDLVASLRCLGVPCYIYKPGPAPELSELEVRLAEVENELRLERYKRLRAERDLNEIETEKRVPFVVPALFRAFLMVCEMDGIRRFV